MVEAEPCRLIRSTLGAALNSLDKARRRSYPALFRRFAR
jgi:hypothetical protein